MVLDIIVKLHDTVLNYDTGESMNGGLPSANTLKGRRRRRIHEGSSFLSARLLFTTCQSQLAPVLAILGALLLAQSSLSRDVIQSSAIAVETEGRE